MVAVGFSINPLLEKWFTTFAQNLQLLRTRWICLHSTSFRDDGVIREQRIFCFDVVAFPTLPSLIPEPFSNDPATLDERYR